tara:strand:+ start:266 stop:838 length:573 start_codon:yes stop_codon:yes gene_type:complete
MPIVLNGSGTVTGISAGGLPDGIIQAADLATGVGGKILQVIQTVKKDKTTIQSTSLVDIAGMSVTITPSSASNKVLIRYCVSAFTNNQYWAMRLLRGSDSTIFIGDQNASATSQTRGSFGSYMSSYVDGRSVTQELLDSPNTTSATTYKLQAHSPYSSSYIIGINSSPTNDNYTYMTNCVSTITAMEVAA